jgi:hypothetical protein
VIRRYFEAQPVLAVSGALSLLCALLIVPLIATDPVEILGINRWVKPVKFFASVTVFVWTLAIYLSHLKGFGRVKIFVSWSTAAVFVLEMALIVSQSWRGVASHFNVGTSYDGFVYGAMGIAIGFNTLLVGVIFVLFLTGENDLPLPVADGMRLGLLIFLLGSLQGAHMAAQPGHAVGAPDGGPGLPFLNWSTTAGDLRVAHFLGLHAIQSIPLFALFANRFAPSGARVLVRLFALFYAASFVVVLVQALYGHPFWPGLNR